jgi:hypothetical protein
MIAASGHIGQVHLWNLSQYKKYLSIQTRRDYRHSFRLQAHSHSGHTIRLSALTQTVATNTKCEHLLRLRTLTQTADTHSDRRHSLRPWTLTQTVNTHSDCEHSLRMPHHKSKTIVVSLDQESAYTSIVIRQSNWWWLNSSGIWYCIIWCVVPNVLKCCSTFNVRVKWSLLGLLDL